MVKIVQTTQYSVTIMSNVMNNAMSNVIMSFDVTLLNYLFTSKRACMPYIIYK